VTAPKESIACGVRILDNRRMAPKEQECWVSTRVVTPEGVRSAAVVVEDGVVVAVLDATPAGMRVHDWGDDALLPGLVDTHVHINEPGRTEWEGFETATRAAAAGGFTTVVDMPLNCLPETTTVASLEIKRAAAMGKCRVDWAAWGGAVDGNQGHILPLARAGVPGYKCFLVYPGCDGFTSIDAENLERALPAIAESGLPLLVHAELQGPIDAAYARLHGADWRKYATYLASRPDEAELDAIAYLIGLCRRYRFKLHIVHLATALALPMLREAKAEGLPITVETCPHYLHLSAEQIPDGATQFKCAPPVRSAANREGLWEALREGVIDLVATDHSPCPPEMKKFGGRFDEAWGGIASLSTALSVMWTEAEARGFSLNEIARWMSAAPASLAGLEGKTGAISVGRDANFVRFAPEDTRFVDEIGLHYRHKVSPYLGEKLRGVVKSTVLRGILVYQDGEFALEATGREYAENT
jgi:allantoinase